MFELMFLNAPNTFDLGLLADYLFPILSVLLALVSLYFKSELNHVKSEQHLKNQALSEKLEEQRTLFDKLERTLEANSLQVTSLHTLLTEHLTHTKSFDKRLDRLEKKAGVD